MLEKAIRRRSVKSTNLNLNFDAFPIWSIFAESQVKRNMWEQGVNDFLLLIGVVAGKLLVVDRF